MRYLKTRTGVILNIAFLAGALVSCSKATPDREYDECIQNAAQLPTATGVKIASVNCERRFTEQGQAAKAVASDSSAGTIANAYWDGWNFQSGKIPDRLKDKGYRIFSVARYGVAVCDVALPEAMGKELFNEDGSFNQSQTLNSGLVEICSPK
jgi:hypothetical protein